jgi:mannose/fructose/N-acetylgalactosamine-specific phosphotransferase system component IIB
VNRSARPAVDPPVIALVRVDNRLLHGQILETWIPRLSIGEVLVADDEAAGSAFAQAAMTLCVPPDLPVRIAPVSGIDWSALARGRTPVLVLVRDVPALAQAYAAGLTPALVHRINVGNVHFEPGRRPVTPSVFLSQDEVRTLRTLAERGFEVEARAIPSEPPAGMAEIERRYAAGH